MSIQSIAEKKQKKIKLNAGDINVINTLAKELGIKRGRKRLAKTLQIYVKEYLLSDVSVRHFRKWAEKCPGDAITWAYKVVYGDQAGAQGVSKGQVNVLVSILTGQQAPVHGDPQANIDQSLASGNSDNQYIVVDAGVNPVIPGTTPQDVVVEGPEPEEIPKSEIR